MSLESIVKIYGWNDYLDTSTGRVYKLSEVNGNKDGTLSVPVVDVAGLFIGYAKMYR